MARFNLGGATTPVSKNVNQDTLYLDSTKSDSIVEDMKKQYQIMVSSATELAKYSSQLTAAQAVTGAYDTACKTLSNTCKARATYAGKRNSSLVAKYNEDVKDYALKLLQDKFADLEARLAKMEAAAQQTAAK